MVVTWKRQDCLVLVDPLSQSSQTGEHARCAAVDLKHVSPAPKQVTALVLKVVDASYCVDGKMGTTPKDSSGVPLGSRGILVRTELVAFVEGSLSLTCPVLLPLAACSLLLLLRRPGERTVIVAY